ncbi:YlbF family regulator [Brevibacillus sp. SYP-B805]|uniref:YlbF family regulator n=1 Tax=Brevibacillus sp. SYP-B805 TaxID=1578199 RepID=UPI0013E9E268|nr:YlbF family regulator [Brevibacillus sp. SYP-B805]NGQ95007.1 YlbF family regulator [Brevibacillus sp. SYP-B805]
MASVVGITAHLQAKNQISPQLHDVVKMTRNAAKEMLQLDDATQEMIKEMRKIKQAAEQSERGFKREVDQMQREIQDLRRQLGILDSTRAHPKVSVDDQARREIAAIRQEIKALDGAKAKVQVEAAQAGGGGELAAGGVIGGMTAYVGAGYIDQLTMETQANARRALLGDTPEELLQFQRQAQDLSMINTNVDRTYIKDLMTQATRFDPENGAEITKQALQLNAIRPDLGGVEEYQKTIIAMRQAWKDVTDISRFGDTLAEIANTTTDIRGEALDSIVEYSTQVTKFLDTPEKLAALVKEMNNLWSIDKGFDALKEATIKLDNQGDMVNVLKTAYEAQGMDSETAQKKAQQESKTIAQAIHSDSVAENQFAVAALLQTFGGIQDQKVRQELLNELGAGPGEDIAKAFAPLLQAAGRIGMADGSQYNYRGKLEQSYKTYQESDPLRGFIEAKTMFANELIGLGTVIAQEVSPVIKGLGIVVKGTKEAFDALPTWLALPALGTALGLATVALWKFKVALSAATEAAVRRRLGGDIPDIDIPDKDNKNERSGRKGRGGKRSLWNPLSWGRKEEIPERKWLTSAEAAKKALGGSLPEEVAKVSKSGVFERLKGLGGMLPKGDTVVSGLKSAWAGVKSLSGGLAKRIPLIGTAIGAAEILTSDNKLEAAGRVGSEALGAWGGAAAGAAIGSVVPIIGTTVGGIVGGIAGALGGGALFDKVKAWWSDAPATPPTPTHPGMIKPEELNKLRPAPPVAGPPIPPVSPVGKAAEKPKLVSVTVSSIPITLKAEGVLQDVAGMLRLLRDPSVSNEVKRIVEKALIDALETSGGVASGGVPS